MAVWEELAWLGKAMAARGLVVGPGGNISGREGDRVWLSPTGYELDTIAPEEWAVVELPAEKQVAGLKPTCEVEMHVRIYQARPEIRFICHAHPATTTGLISGGQEILPLTPDFVALVDRIVYLPFIVPAGTELAQAVQTAFRTGVNCVALRNHGIITLGRSAREALARALVVEDQARTQVAALCAGHPRPLTSAEQAAVRNLDAEEYRRKLLAQG